MRRRLILLGPLALAGCGLSTRPYVERHEWPLDPVRPPGGARPGRDVLLLRGVRAGPAVVARGLQTIQPDGSLSVGFYDEWLAPPADLFEAALRAWLTASGRFAAVTAPGARLDATMIAECELVSLVADPAAGVARCDAALLVTRDKRVVAQRAIRGIAPLARDATPAGSARAMREAAADACAQIERAIA